MGFFLGLILVQGFFGLVLEALQIWGVLFTFLGSSLSLEIQITLGKASCSWNSQPNETAAKAKAYT